MSPFNIHKTIRHDELIERLQIDARMLFYDHMMYDINDSLTSILALCDIEAKKSVPRIKEYISRINDSLQNTKNYHTSFTGEKRFNITLVIKNIIRVLEENYKQVQLMPFVSEIKAPCSGDQSLFEQILLCLLVDICEREGNESAIMIELKQKEQNATLTLFKDDFTFSKECRARVDKFTAESDFKGRIRTSSTKNGTEVVIQIPLQFKTVRIEKPPVKKGFFPKKESAVKHSRLFNWDDIDITPDIAY
ncbi:hypothetical protein JW752_02250 [Candidatus Peregrinibacteria bacterium]|nr:hypothetical protein [Candidatus Peregrinibacteria bacterium]